MRRMGHAPGQQGARAHEVSGREKQGGAPGRPQARARAMPGTRWQAVPAHAQNDPETANLKQNLTCILDWKGHFALQQQF